MFLTSVLLSKITWRYRATAQEWGMFGNFHAMCRGIFMVFVKMALPNLPFLPGLPFLPLCAFTLMHAQERSQVWSRGVRDGYSSPSLTDQLWVQPSRAVLGMGDHVSLESSCPRGQILLTVHLLFQAWITPPIQLHMTQRTNIPLHKPVCVCRELLQFMTGVRFIYHKELS